MQAALEFRGAIMEHLRMKTTLNIDDRLLAEAREYTGEKDNSALVRMGLELLIQRGAAKRLAAMGGSMPDLRLPDRGRP
jgi:Arc/MetJ family transcription regulator